MSADGRDMTAAWREWKARPENKGAFDPVSINAPPEMACYIESRLQHCFMEAFEAGAEWKGRDVMRKLSELLQG